MATTQPQVINGTNGVNGASRTTANGSSPSTSSDGLHIIIIGAGIGGLTAAIYLRKQGHHVTLLEQSRFANEVGAAMHLAPNANGLLRRVGLFAEEIGANLFERASRLAGVETRQKLTRYCFAQITEFNANNEQLRDIDLTESNKQWQHPWHLVHRVRLHEELKRRATSRDGPGVPAELQTCSRVVHVDPESAMVWLESGDKIQGDLVIGADGVHVSDDLVLCRFQH